MGYLFITSLLTGWTAQVSLKLLLERSLQDAFKAMKGAVSTKYASSFDFFNANQTIKMTVIILGEESSLSQDTNSIKSLASEPLGMAL